MNRTRPTRTFSFIFLFLSLAILLPPISASVLWQATAEGGNLAGPPLPAGKLLIATSNDGLLTAFEAASGKPAWVKPTNARPAAPPLASGDRLVLATTDGRVLALNLSQAGSVIWEARAGNRSYGLAFANASDVIVTSDTGVQRLALADGRPRWRQAFAAPGQKTPPAYALGRAYFTNEKTAYALDANTGNAVWSASLDAPGWNAAPAVTATGTIVVCAADGSVRAFAPEGTPLWANPGNGACRATPLAVSDSILYGTDDGRVTALNAIDGRTRWTFTANGGIAAPLALAQLGGTTVVLAAARDSRIYALDANSGQLLYTINTDDWPMGTSVGTAAWHYATLTGRVTAYDPQTACGIDQPQDGELVTDAPLRVTGTAFATSGIARVEVQTPAGTWLPASGTRAWQATLDAAALPSETPALITCRVATSDGQLAVGQGVHVTRSQRAPALAMTLDAPSELRNSKSFTAKVRDENGRPVDNATIDFDGTKYYTKNGTAQVYAQRSGTITLTASKPGYQTVTKQITVPMDSTWYIALALMFLIAAIAYFRLRK